jgi:acyl-CoA thioester hydrolase
MPLSPALGRLQGSEHRFAVRVYFEDTDLTGMVYHANYLRYLERARSDMLLAVQVDQRAAHEAGTGAYAIRDIRLQYRAPARLNDELMVVSRVMRLRPAALDIHQRVMRGPELVAEGHVEAVFVAPSGRPRRQPAEWMSRFAALMEQGE